MSPIHRLSVILVILLYQTLSTECLDVEKVREMRCIKPQPDVARNVAYEWVFAVDRWYIPLQSRLNLYRYAETLLSTPVANLTESQVDPAKTCMSYTWSSKGPKLYGDDKLTISYTTTMVIENTFGFTSNWIHETRGRHYITLRDNKTFLFFTTCWGDGFSSWSVLSTQPEIDAESHKLILEHLKSLGFKEEFLVKNSYDTCSSFPSTTAPTTTTTTTAEL